MAGTLLGLRKKTQTPVSASWVLLMINIPANVLICDGGDIVGPKKEDADARQRFFGAVGDEELLLARSSRFSNCAVTLKVSCSR